MAKPIGSEMEAWSLGMKKNKKYCRNCGLELGSAMCQERNAFVDRECAVPVGCLVVLALATLWVGMRPHTVFPVAQIRLGEGESRSDRSDRRRVLVFRMSGLVAVVAVTGSMLVGLLR